MTNNKTHSTLQASLFISHGAWVPLSLMYPKANIPIVQLSLLHSVSPEEHFRIGHALGGLRKEGVLILGSGGLVHNLRKLKAEGSSPDHWAQSFENGCSNSWNHAHCRNYSAMLVKQKTQSWPTQLTSILCLCLCQWVLVGQMDTHNKFITASVMAI